MERLSGLLHTEEFLRYLQNHEIEMREDMANKRPLEMTNEDCKKYRSATEYHICNKNLVKDLYCDCVGSL